jgi:phosphoribosylglycinamide formyltransferase 1
MSKKIAVLASQTGSLFESIVDSGIPVALLLVDRKCPALEIAKTKKILAAQVTRAFNNTFSRVQYTNDVLDLLRSHQIDLVVLAGFMTVFSEALFAKEAYANKVINSHPSLLPDFKGAHAVRDALAAGVKETGCTIHFVTPELDAGAIIAQQAVAVLLGDTVESLHARIKQVEHKLYPTVIKDLL